MVLPGAHLGHAAATAAVGAVVYLGVILAPQAPGSPKAGWQPTSPARAYTPGQAELIQARLAEVGCSFLPSIFGADGVGGRRDQLPAVLAPYTAAMAPIPPPRRGHPSS